MFKILFFETVKEVKIYFKIEEKEYLKNKAKGLYDAGEDSIFHLKDKAIVGMLIDAAKKEKKEVLFVEPPERSLLAAMF